MYSLDYPVTGCRISFPPCLLGMLWGTMSFCQKMQDGFHGPNSRELRSMKGKMEPEQRQVLIEEGKKIKEVPLVLMVDHSGPYCGRLV